MTDERHVSDDLLIDLASELLPAVDREVAMCHVRSCAVCEGRLREIVSDRETLRASSIPPVGRRGIGTSATARSRGRSRAAGMIAAVAAAVVLALVVFPRRDAPDVGSLEVWIPTDRVRALSRLPSSSEGRAELDAALAAYESRDRSRALTLLSSPEVPTGLEEIRDLYLASVLVLNERPKEAEELLIRLDLPSMPQPDRGWARLTLYAALRQLGRDEEADRLIRDLVLEPGEVGRLAGAELERIRGQAPSPEARGS